VRSLLVVRGQATDLALDAAEVTRVTPRAQWPGGTLLDAMGALGLTPEGEGEANVLELRDAPALLTLGPLLLLDLADEAVLRLPPLYESPVQEVVLGEGHPVLVLRASSLGRLGSKGTA
jgi:hypothetical protein